ncbi:MAG: histidinol-phosphate transaminase [Candidatus Micrarchaeaceae archaeon]
MTKHLQTLRMDYSGAGYQPSPAVGNAIRDSIPYLDTYPHEGYDELHKSLTRYCGVKQENVLATNGADEAIGLLTTHYGKRVLIPAPTYGEYEYIAKSLDSEIVERECLNSRGEYKLNYTKKDLDWATLVWVCSPNNPTGTYIPKRDIEWVAQHTKAMVVADEAYFEYAGKTAMDLIKKYPNIIVLRTFSKAFSIAGLRLGYMVSNGKVISKFSSSKQEYNVNRVARAAGIAALESMDYYKRKIAETKALRDDFQIFARNMGLWAFDSEARFTLLKFRDEKELDYVYRNLEKRNIIVFHAMASEFSGLKGPYIRVAISNRPEMLALESALSDIIAEYRH